LQLKVEIQDADPGYVVDKLTREIYVHLRAVPANIDFRRQALERAGELYANCDPTDEGRRGGLGLLVLQRAMLAVEDLGGLLYALDVEPPSFERLVSYRLDELSSLFVRLFGDPSLTPRLFRLPRLDLSEEPDLSEDERKALKDLCTITLARLDAHLLAVRHFWESFNDEAKQTMHGLGFVAGRYALEPPGAGMLTQAVEGTPERPFALPLTSRLDELARHVSTEVGLIDLTPAAMDGFVRAAEAALEATTLLVEAHLARAEKQCLYIVPSLYLDRLDPPSQEAIAHLFDD